MVTDGLLSPGTVLSSIALSQGPQLHIEVEGQRGASAALAPPHLHESIASPSWTRQIVTDLKVVAGNPVASAEPAAQAPGDGPKPIASSSFGLFDGPIGVQLDACTARLPPRARAMYAPEVLKLALAGAKPLTARRRFYLEPWRGTEAAELLPGMHRAALGYLETVGLLAHMRPEAAAAVLRHLPTLADYTARGRARKGRTPMS